MSLIGPIPPRTLIVCVIARVIANVVMNDATMFTSTFSRVELTR